MVDSKIGNQSLGMESTYTDFGYDVLSIEITSNSGGESIDMRDMWFEIVIYESIMDDKLVGEVLFKDGMNLSETLPIVGNETIKITYRTAGYSGDPVELVGKVFAPQGKARVPNEKSEVYKLQFVSDLQFRNRFVRVNGAYSGIVSDMARKIFNNSFGPNYSSKLSIGSYTNGIHKFVFPNWSPVFALRWLANNAYVSQDQPSLFFFYEDVDGFHFRDLIAETSKKPALEYRVEPKNSVNIGSVMGFLTRVEDYSITSYFDRLEEHSAGMFASSLVTHDITSKNISRTTMDYNDLFYRTKTHMNKHPFFPQETDMNRMFTNSASCVQNCMPVQSQSTGGIRNNFVPEKYVLDRNSLFKSFTTQIVTITVPGVSTLRLLDTLQFSIPKIGYIDQSDTDWEDQYLSGKYIVLSIKTTINRKMGYRCVVEMSKDSSIRGIPSKYESSKLNNLQ
jgi:hypothetical protein